MTYALPVSRVRNDKLWLIQDYVVMQQVFAVKPGAALFESALVPWFCGLGRNAKVSITKARMHKSELLTD